MALLGGNRIAWTYHSDDGNTYRVAAMSAMTVQDVLGGELAGGALPEKPSAIKIRRVTVSDTAGRSRVLPCYSTDAAIVVAGTGVLANFAGDSHAMTSNGGFIPEGGPRKNVTKQQS